MLATEGWWTAKFPQNPDISLGYLPGNWQKISGSHRMLNSTVSSSDHLDWLLWPGHRTKEKSSVWDQGLRKFLFVYILQQVPLGHLEMNFRSPCVHFLSLCLGWASGDCGSLAKDVCMFLSPHPPLPAQQRLYSGMDLLCPGQRRKTST